MACSFLFILGDCFFLLVGGSFDWVISVGLCGSGLSKQVGWAAGSLRLWFLLFVVARPCT